MYAPKEDSFLLLSCISRYIKKGSSFLEVGAGSGIISKEAKKLGAKVTASDINPEVVRELKKQGFNAIHSDLFTNFGGKFDLIIFNPPYLPLSKFDNEPDTTGGKMGDETILRFLKQAPDFLNKNGRILLLLSSFTPRMRINKLLKNLKHKKIAEEKLFFETLEVLEISQQ